VIKVKPSSKGKVKGVFRKDEKRGEGGKNGNVTSERSRSVID
jgi:hypothetical protein